MAKLMGVHEQFSLCDIYVFGDIGFYINLC